VEERTSNDADQSTTPRLAPDRLLLLASAGCTRRDWVGDMLVLVDVSGTWEATFTAQGTPSRTFLMTLQQSGTRVTGDTWAIGAPTTRSAVEGALEGVVNGEVFTFTLGPGVRGEVHLDGEEMSGSIVGPPAHPLMGCPCPILLRRSGPAPTPRSQP
jgi:hypothetical protein